MKISLRFKWTTVVVSFILLISIATYFVSIRQGITTIRKELTERGLTLALGLSYNSEYGLYTENKEILNNLIEGIMRVKDVSYCGIYNRDKKILAKSGEVLSPLGYNTRRTIEYIKKAGIGYFDIVVPVYTRAIKKDQDEMLLISEEEWIRKIKKPVEKPKEDETTKEVMGFVQVGISELNALNSIKKLKMNIAWVSALIMLFGIFITMFFVNRLIEPIHMLSMATQSIATGNLRERITIRRNDELGVLAHSFNKMTDTISISQEKLLSAKNYTDSIMANMIDALVVTDPNGLIRTVNKSTEDLLDYRKEELIGKSISSIFPKNILLDMALENESFNNYEFIYKAKTGKEIPLLFSGSVMRDKNGEFTGVILTALDITERKEAQEKLQESFKILQRVLNETITALASAVEQRDMYTAGHQQRVTRLALAIARDMKFTEEQLVGLQMASAIHDLGKLYVPAEILSKPTTLSEIEFALIKLHPKAGHDILKTVEFPWPVAQIVYEHHERLNGSGYPQGLRADKILPEAKVLAVADVVDAMISHRPYRPAFFLEKALDELSKNRGILYDPKVVDTCLVLFKEKGFILD